MKYKTFRTLVAGGCATMIAGTMGACVACGYFGSSEPSPKRPDVTVNNPQQSGPVQSSTPTNPQPATAPTQPAGNPLAEGPDGVRPLDTMIVNYLKSHPANTDKIKDAFPRERFKVNIYRDAPDTTWSRLKIDFDRDEKDDEKWTLAGGEPAKRQVSTADNGQYDKEYRWLGGKWSPKQN